MRPIFLVLLLLISCAAHAQDHMRKTALPTPLDTYVATPDPAYKYELVNEKAGDDWHAYTLKLVSQQYLTDAEVDRPVWEHWVSIVVPAEVKYHTAFLSIGGGSNKPEAPEGPAGMARMLGTRTHSVAIELGQIPNEPLVFKDDGKKRTEDSIIAYTWDKFMRTGDTKWPLRLPMTKAVVRCMDAAQEFCKGLPTPVLIDDFVVAGGSKRGWTTWTTAAVDTRVRAIAPAVIDMLNVVPSFRHHWEAYGGWAEAVGDYQELEIFSRMETPEYAELMMIEEPFNYRERFTMPKFVVNAADDQFFLPDSQQFYWDELPGEKRLRCVPNAGHSLGGSDVMESIQAYYNCILADAPLPEYAWTFPDGHTTAVTTGATPKAVKLWQAHNAETRDFRIETVTNKAWTETDLTADANGAYTGAVETPEKGWRAFMVELTFDVEGDADLKFTTPVRVTPETMPFDYVPAANPIPGYLTTK